MLSLLPWKQIGIAAAIILILTGLWWSLSSHYTDVGRAEVQAKWDKDKAARAKAEELAIAGRNAKNAQEKEKQDQINQTITEKYNDELTKVRNDLAIAKRVRVGTAICGARSTGPSEAKNAEGSTPADTRAIVVRDDIDRDLRALMIRVEEGFAAGRACQGWGIENGFAE